MDKIIKMILDIFNFQKVFKKRNSYSPLFNKGRWKQNNYKGNIAIREEILKLWQKHKKMSNREGKRDKKYSKNTKIKFKSVNHNKY